MADLLIISTSFLLIGGISWFFFGKRKEDNSQEIQDDSSEEVLELNISGMHCAGCAAGIEGTIKSIPGVKSAQVNFATSKGIFVIQPSKIKKETIIEKIKELGYEASLDIDNLEKKS